MLEHSYTWAWAIWIGMFAIIEGAALMRKEPGDTLSEHVWDWFDAGKKPRGWTLRRIGLGAFMLWLTAHFLFGV